MAQRQAMVDGFLRALCEPRFQTLVDEFYAIRGKVVIQQEKDVADAVGFLLTTIRTVLQDRHAEVIIEQQDDVATQLEEAIGCIDSAADFALNVSFQDTVTFLHLFCSRMSGTDPPQVLLAKLDDTLALIGMARVSVRQLWESTEQVHRDDLWRAVHSLLKTVQCQCSVPTAP